VKAAQRLARATALAAAASLSACAGPLGPFAGGRLAGSVVTEASSDWSFTRDVKIVQLETRPDRPWSVNLGCVDWNGALYVGTEDPSDRWVRNIEADPRVRLRIGERIWERRAVRVTDPNEWTGAGLALFRKYDLHYEAGETEEHGWLFRLDPP
jgi:hypothetical protein